MSDDKLSQERLSGLYWAVRDGCTTERGVLALAGLDAECRRARAAEEALTKERDALRERAEMWKRSATIAAHALGHDAALVAARREERDMCADICRRSNTLAWAEARIRERWPQDEPVALVEVSVEEYCALLALANRGPGPTPELQAAFARYGVSAGAARPPVVCLCGSTRFYDAFARAAYEESLAGRIVLTVGFAPGTAHGEAIGCTPEQKTALDELHKRRIDLADEVFILNVGGYVGPSTRSELEYARACGKRVRFLEEEIA